MQAVLISIRPKWCEKIANVEKTIEVRKRRPKMDLPIKCYIYRSVQGGVIGEFVCDEIIRIDGAGRISSDVARPACLEPAEIHKYLGAANGYGWHISNLKIYDEPLLLNTFKKWFRECGYSDLGLAIPDCDKCTDSGCFVQKPPQSWCFVEELP